MQRMKPWDELTIRDNYLFKKVLSLNEDLCRRLLERVLGITIAKMDIVQTELGLESDYKAKSVRLDVYAEDDCGRVYDIEMQAADMADDQLFLRTRYYQAMIDQGLLEKGQPYSRLRESYIIFVCAFDPSTWGCAGTRSETAATSGRSWPFPTGPFGFSLTPRGHSARNRTMCAAFSAM